MSNEDVIDVEVTSDDVAWDDAPTSAKPDPKPTPPPMDPETARLKADADRLKAEADLNKAKVNAHETGKEAKAAEKEAAKTARKEAVKDAFKDGARRAAGIAKAGAKRAGEFALERGIMLGALGVPVIGEVVLVAGALDMFHDMVGQCDILHHQPEEGRTQFLPVARNGNMDNPHGNAANSVDTMDKHIRDINDQSFGFDPPTVCSYCEGGCDQGCHPVTATIRELNGDAAVTPLDNWKEVIESIPGIFTANDGEMWADRMASVYGQGGSAKLPELVSQTDAVATALQAAVKTSDTMGQHAFAALREAIKLGREEMQKRVEDENSTLGWVGDFFTDSRGVGASDRLQERLGKVQQAAQENDGAVKALNDALAAWGKQVETGAGNRSGHHPKKESTHTDPGKPTAPDPKPADPAPAAPAAPADDLGKKLDDLINSKPGDNPLGGGDPLGGGSPLGGGGMPSMPSMGGGAPGGGDPMGGGAPLGGNHDDPFGKDKDAALTDDDKKDDPFKDDKDKDHDKDDKDKDHDKKDDVKSDVGDNPAQPAANADPAQAVPPVAGGDVPNVHSDDVAARTVTLPNGRAVTFDDPKEAAMVRNLVNAEDGAPKSVYEAASAAGYDLPPQGQDIGKLVEPTDMKPGDVVAGPDHKSGVYLGNDDVLMEDKSIKKLSDFGDFSGPNQGVFHLDSGHGGGDAAQPMGSGSDLHSGQGTTSTPGQVSAPAGAPGVPSDTTAAPAGDTTASGGAGGSASNVTGMNPDTAAAN